MTLRVPGGTGIRKATVSGQSVILNVERARRAYRELSGLGLNVRDCTCDRADLGRPGPVDCRPTKNGWESLFAGDKGFVDENVRDFALSTDATALVERTRVREDRHVPELQDREERYVSED